MSIYMFACRSEADEPMEEAVARGVIIVSSLVVRQVVPKWRVGKFLVTELCLVHLRDNASAYGNRGAARREHAMNIGDPPRMTYRVEES